MAQQGLAVPVVEVAVLQLSVVAALLVFKVLKVYNPKRLKTINSG